MTPQKSKTSLIMSFANELKQKVQNYENYVDENLISSIKKKCELAAEEGKTNIYIENPLSTATRETLKNREGLEILIAEVGCHTYRILW